MKKLIIFIFIVGLAMGLLGYYYYQRNTYSKEVLKMEILGTEEIQAFDEIEYLVKLKNNGNVVLEEPELIFQYPEDSLPTNENSKRVEKSLEDIYPGQEMTISFKARVFGKLDEAKKAEATLKYRPKSLKAFYESKTSLTSKIKSLPLTFEIDLPSKIESGKEIRFFLNYFSNCDWPLANLRITIEYPLGFEFLQSQPRALEKTNWDLPLLNKAEGGRIEIRGKLTGEVKEQKIFRATLGLWQEGRFVLLKEVIKGTEILKSSLAVFQEVNGSSQYIAFPGDLLHYQIFFRNTGEQPFENLFLVVKLEGQPFDFESIKTDSGQINKAENSIVWDWRDVSKLKFLDQGEEGSVDFWINLKNDWPVNYPNEKNFLLKDKVIISQTKEDFETKVASRLELFQKGFFNDEVFGNSGSVPPKVGQSTTYTINWQVKNYYNNLTNVKVRAVLPAQAKLTGKILPEDARLTFDSESREIVWEIGDLEPGAGIVSPPPTISFQISFLPQESQRGQTPEIIGKAKVSGEDLWVEKTIEKFALPITTALPDDPSAGGPVQ